MFDFYVIYFEYFILFFSSQNTIGLCVKLMTCFCSANGPDGLEVFNELNLADVIVGEGLATC